MNKITIPHHLAHVSPVFDVTRDILALSIKDGRGQEHEGVLSATIEGGA